MARRIRVWKEDGCYHATLNCIDRMFLLKPSPEINNIIGSSLGRALAKHPVQLHSATTNINHMEINFSLGRGQTQNASAFLRLFESLVAKEINRHYRREGHFWSSRARVEEIIGDAKAEKLLGYGACNVVKDGLVDRARDWTGFSTTEALTTGKELVFEYVNRTLWWKAGADFRKVDRSKYTRRVEIKLVPLACWSGMSQAEQRERFERIVSDHEEMARIERAAEGITHVKGRSGIAKENPFSKPRNLRKKSPEPLCHADTMEQYELYKTAYREVIKAYRIASAAYRLGCHNVEFPSGTFRPPLVTPFLERAA